MSVMSYGVLRFFYEYIGCGREILDGCISRSTSGVRSFYFTCYGCVGY